MDVYYVPGRSYATGGSTLNELWAPPHELGSSLLPGAGGTRFEHVESCTTHNMVRTLHARACKARHVSAHAGHAM